MTEQPRDRGITSPKGWHVTYPNLPTAEAVRGAEQYKFDQRFPDTAARHNTVLVFTRNVVGPLDYLRRLPVVWDEVRYLGGEPGSHVLLARRAGDAWWIAGINGTYEPMTVLVDLGLDEPQAFVLGVDGAEGRTIDRLERDGGAIEIQMEANCGFFAWPASER